MVLTYAKLNELKTEAKGLLEDMGLTVPNNYSYKLNKRKNAAGICNYSTKTISMSTYVAQYRDESSSLNTMVHEMLHAICPNSGHTGRWKYLASQVNSTHGIDIKRCYTANQEQQTASKERKMAKAQGRGYLLSCTCGFEQTATRKTKAVKTVLGESGGYLSIGCPKCKSTDKFSVVKL